MFVNILKVVGDVAKDRHLKMRKQTFVKPLTLIKEEFNPLHSALYHNKDFLRACDVIGDKGLIRTLAHMAQHVCTMLENVGPWKQYSTTCIQI